MTINGESYGATPVVASLPRGKNYVVQVRKENYLPHEMTVVPVMNSMTWGNLFLGGIVGMAVDGATNAIYEHSLSRVHAFFAVPVGQVHKRDECPESVVVVAARRKEAEQARFVQSGLTPYDEPRKH
ncbi:MAG: PEGA domain-containing protein [Nitrospira sp.]|nr:PEGA domain-containing protein [Nitrospira sp.]MDI3466161.1 hypothetical protein [Nitrospira sp.]